MATTSEVIGTMTLIGQWDDEMIKNLNIVKGEWEKWYYHITLSHDFSATNTPVPFTATAKWIFDVDLIRLGCAVDTVFKSPDAIASYKKLCELLADKTKDEEPTAYIELDFSEQGYEMLRKCTAIICYDYVVPPEGMPIEPVFHGEVPSTKQLVGYVQSEERFDCTEENIRKLGFNTSTE
jgi:hypothetical protein